MRAGGKKGTPAGVGTAGMTRLERAVADLHSIDSSSAGSSGWSTDSDDSTQITNYEQDDFLFVDEEASTASAVISELTELEAREDCEKPVLKGEENTSSTPNLQNVPLSTASPVCVTKFLEPKLNNPPRSTDIAADSTSVAAIPALTGDLELLLMNSVYRHFKESPDSFEQDHSDTLKELNKLQMIVGNTPAGDGKVQMKKSEPLYRHIFRLLNNLGCFLCVKKSRDAAVGALCQSLNVLIHRTDYVPTPSFSSLSNTLRRVLMHLIQKKTKSATTFIKDALIVLSNLLKIIIAKDRFVVGKYIVDPVCGLESACVLVKTNAELHVWLGRFQESITNYEILANLLNQRLAADGIKRCDEITLRKETVNILQKMQLICGDVLSDKTRATECEIKLIGISFDENLFW